MSMVTLKGPLFTSNIKVNVTRATSDIVRETTYFGEEAVQAQLYPGHGVRTGTFRFYVRGRVSQSRQGYIYPRDYLKGAWLEGTSSRNQTTRFKGYGMFRRGRDRTDREVARISAIAMKKFTRAMN